MSYSEQNWLKHEGRNPAHVFGGYDRWRRFPDGTKYMLVLPRNPGRWLAHTKTADGTVLRNRTEPVAVVSRQQIRHAKRVMAKVKARGGRK